MNSTSTHVALARLAEAGLLDAAEADWQIGAERLWRSISGLLRLTVGRWREEQLPESVAAALLHACRRLHPDDAPVDLPALQAQMARRANEVRAVFERRLGKPDINGERE